MNKEIHIERRVSPSEAIYLTPLQKLAYDKSQNAEDENKLMNTDITEKWHKEIDICVRDRQKIGINVNGMTSIGKSTVAIRTSIDVNNALLKYSFTNKQFSERNIARNQYEASKFYRNYENYNTVLMTDEYDALDDTGENSTTEIRAREQLSTDHAQRYIYDVKCSPKESPDSNLQYTLNVISQDKKTNTNIALLYYELFRVTSVTPVLLGYVKFYVTDIIKNWVKIRNTFIDLEERKKNIDKINLLRKKDFYVNYQCRKHEQMELLTKHKISRKRELEYAECQYEIGQKLKVFAELDIPYENMIETYVMQYYRQHDLMMSLLGKKEAISKISSYLQMFKSKTKLKKEINKLYSKCDKSIQNIPDIDKSKAVKDCIEMEKIRLLEKSLQDFNKEIEKVNANLLEMMELKKQYEQI